MDLARVSLLPSDLGSNAMNFVGIQYVLIISNDSASSVEYCPTVQFSSVSNVKLFCDN